MNEYMNLANKEAKNGIHSNHGGPFGSVIVDPDGRIIATGHNRVLIDNDPTAHGEIVAIRNATKKLGTYDLSGYTLYTNAEPCPMCLSAIIWANIKNVYYGCNRMDAEKIGFRDNMIYEYLENENDDILNIMELNREESLETFDEYKNMNGTIY